MFAHPFREPFLLASPGLGISADCQGRSHNVLVASARNNGLRVLGIEAAIRFVADDEAIIGVVDDETVRMLSIASRNIAPSSEDGSRHLPATAHGPPARR